MTALRVQETEDRPDPVNCALQWLSRLDAALSAGNADHLASLFCADGTWRDMLTLDWRIRSLSAGGAPTELARQLLRAGLVTVVLHPHRTGPLWVRRAEVECVEFFVSFDHPAGRGEGIVRILPDSDGNACAWHLFTYLDQIAGFEESAGERRPRHSRKAARASQYSADRQPDVLIIGAGQAGLSVAARLARMGVDALVIERKARVGQGWRDRYQALVLHNAIGMINLPYLEFPQTWPTYLDKDRIAAWLEFYAGAMDLDVWTDCAAESVDCDPDNGTWSAVLRHGDADPFTITCKHVVVATGVSGKPRIPALPGLDDFRGEIVHSSAYRDGQTWKGRKALVFGTGASGHDIAQDLHAHGAGVTLIQRGAMSVCSIDPGAATVLDALFVERNNEEADLIVASMSYENRVRMAQSNTVRLRELDATLYEGLERIGFKLDFGHDGTGVAMKYARQGGGFYLNGGCSDLLVDGSIGFLQADRMDSFVRDGIRLLDGSVLQADVVVMATGYEPQSAVNRRLLGERNAARVGPVWGIDESGEQRNAWRQTALPGLWFMLGNFQQCRFYSKTLALQICAALAGMAMTL